MPQFLPEYGTTAGPVGVPMTDAQAFALDRLLASLPPEDRAVKKAALPASLAELQAGERADLSWISTEASDREREVIRAAGLDDAHFALNPVVTLNHDYWSPPVGRSVWRRVVTDPVRGVMAKTVYPARPDGYGRDWPADEAFALVQAGLMVGKSVGFLTLQSHPPSEEEIRKDPSLAGVRRVIDKWLLLEYACCWLPINHQTVVSTVSKSFADQFRLAPPPPPAPPAPQPPAPGVPDVPFTPLAELEKGLRRQVDSVNLDAVALEAARAALIRRTGGV